MRTRSMLFVLTGLLGIGLTACSDSGLGTKVVDSNGNRVLQSVDSAMKADQYSFISPSMGGLTGSLYIQPRASMIASDTTVVGCDQRGNGALGLDAYLNQPSWITQEILMREIFVPTRNFTLGFDAMDPYGVVQPVRSFFAVQVDGYFKLDTIDVEGDYQFAIIADDSARLRTTGASGRLLVDNEKPTGVNTTCLDKTQAAHMSCTNSWSDQSTTKVQTIHLKPGDRLPVRFEYWQGPGQGISMMAFYRKVPAAGSGENSCGKELGFAEGSSSLNQILSTWKPIRIENLGNYWNF